MGSRSRRVLPGAGWLMVVSPLLICLVYAPLAFGGTTPSTVAVIDGLLLASFLAWGVLLFAEKRRPSFSPWCWVPLLLLSVIAVTGWANPRSLFEEEFWLLRPISSNITWLPGTVDRASTQEVVLHLAALLLGFFVILDGCSHSRVRWLFLEAIAVSGFLIAVIGIFQKASGAEAMLWVEPDPLKYGNNLFFAAFRYHANAASFLNLCWPAGLVVFLREKEVGRSGVASSLWLTAVVITVIGVFVNTSKAGQILGGVGLVIALIRFRKSIFYGSKVVMVVGGLLLAGIMVVFALPVVSTWAGRWSKDSASASFGGRLEAYETCLRMLPDSGVYGSGVGTFRLLFPLYQNSSADRMVGEFFWYHAHQDYLQTILEWGFLGAAAWVAFYAGGIVRGMKSLRTARERQRIEFSTSCALIGLFVVGLHAMVDFPFQIPAIQIPIVIYMAILWAGGSGDKHKKSRREPAS